jgi:hypothetical protein
LPRIIRNLIGLSTPEKINSLGVEFDCLTFDFWQIFFSLLGIDLDVTGTVSPISWIRQGVQ